MSIGHFPKNPRVGILMTAMRPATSIAPGVERRRSLYLRIDVLYLYWCRVRRELRTSLECVL
jgi:hypothetical protein